MANGEWEMDNAIVHFPLSISIVLRRRPAMLTADGCRKRRERLWQQLDPPPASDYLLLGDPLHLIYFANYWPDPISLGADIHGYLLVRKDGHGKLIYPDRAPKSVQQAYADEK